MPGGGGPSTLLALCYRPERGGRGGRRLLEGGVLVVGLGVDLVDTARVARSLERWGHRLLQKLMAPEEAARLPPPGPERVRALALAIAGKEAASKAIGTGWSHGVRWRDVVVDLGPPPSVRLEGRAAEVALAPSGHLRTRTQLEFRGSLALGQVQLLS